MELIGKKVMSPHPEHLPDNRLLSRSVPIMLSLREQMIGLERLDSPYNIMLDLLIEDEAKKTVDEHN